MSRSTEKSNTFRKKNLRNMPDFTVPILGMIERAEKNITLVNIEKNSKSIKY